MTWLASLESEAGKVLPGYLHTYVRQGSGTSVAADEAAAAWQRFRLVPRTLTGLGTVSTRATFLGTTAAAPFGAAPSTLQRGADVGGEVAMATGCLAAGVPMVLTSNSSTSFAEIAATGVHWWLQAYLTQDRALSRPMLQRAAASGAAAVVLTVDTPVVARKQDGGGPSALDLVPRRWLRVNLGEAADAPKARDLSPADISWLGEVTGLPVVVKGVLHPDDAVRAVEAGAAAVWVSNHGGRQLDRAEPTARCLARVSAAVAGRVPVYVDGGVTDGIAALTALALGADGIFVGRLPFYGLAVGGADGVRRVFTDLADELSEAMLLCGCADPGAARSLEATSL